jgi:hypothetical protein
MWFRSLIDHVTPRASRTPAQRKPRRPTSPRLRLEALEDRCLPSFLSPVSYAVGTNPQAVVTADLGNGKVDLITANAGSNTVSVQLGNGDGTFGPAVSYATGTEPGAVAVGDLGNGKLDIVTANAGDSTVSVLLGNGDGTLKPAVSYASAGGPGSVAIGNFNGKPDIVTANYSGNDLSLLPGTGDGTFGPAQYFATGGSNPVAVAVGDFNGDGKLDLAVTGYTPGIPGSWGYSNYYPGTPPASEVTVLLGHGDGTFTDAWFDELNGDFAPAIVTGDLNGDGKTDLVWADETAGAVGVLVGNGDGTFLAPGSFGTGDNPVGVTLADLNGDGKPDIITADAVGNTVSVLVNNDNGGFGIAEEFTAGPDPVRAAAGDFNGDGFPDLAVANAGSSNVSVLVNTGSWPALQVSGIPSPDTAGQAQTIAVTARDGAGNVRTGYTGTVAFGSGDPQATIVNPATGLPVPLTGFTYQFQAGDNGTRSFTVDLKTAGNQAITVSDAAAGVSGTDSGITVNAAAASSFVVTGFPSPFPADVRGNFAISAQDPYGNVATGYAGTVHLSSSDGQAVLPPDTTLTNGTGSLTATLGTAGYQSITAKDTLTATISGSESGIEVLPRVAITGPSAAAINQTLTFTLGVAGDPPGTIFTYAIDWNGDGTVDQTVTGPSGTSVTHAYGAAGYNYIGVTATDPKGFTGSVTQFLYVAPVSVMAKPDPAAPTKEMLVVSGIANNNTYDTITLAGNSSSVSLTFNATALGNIAPAGGTIALVVVNGEGSYDTIDARSLAVSSVLEGGGNGNILYGGSAPNLLIAGPGSTTLHAGSAGDILIGGTTSYNNNLTALAYIMAEWEQTNVSYATRVGQLDGKLNTGLNGSYLLNSRTVSENNATDWLFGGAGMDWFLAGLNGKHKDSVYGQTSGEVRTSI